LALARRAGSPMTVLRFYCAFRCFCRRSIADMEPAVPAGMARYVVAPQPALFGLARMVQTLRSLTCAPLEVVRSLGEAHGAFGVAGHDFSRAVEA
jgi:hypothetical protein